MKRSALALALVLVACSTTQTVALGRHRTLVTERATVPLRVVSRLPLVQIEINGRGPYWFVFDSGAGAVVVSPRLPEARDAERILSGGEMVDGEGRRRNALAFVQLDELAVGSGRFADVVALVTDLSILQRETGVDVMGLLPLQLFDELLVTVDYPRSTLTLERGALPGADGRHILATTIAGGCMSVDLDVGGRAVRACIDTGASSLYLPARLADALGAHPVVVGEETTIAGPEPWREGRIPVDVVLGALRLLRPRFVVSPTPVLGLGDPIFRSLAVTFDTRHRLLRLTRADDAPIATPPLRDAGFDMVWRAGHWTVSYLRGGGPAAASGLRVGDRLVSVQDRPEASLDKDMLENLAGDASDLRIVVERGGRRIAFDVPVVVVLP